MNRINIHSAAGKCNHPEPENNHLCPVTEETVAFVQIGKKIIPSDTCISNKCNVYLPYILKYLNFFE
jgi:hypothetical protein